MHVVNQQYLQLEERIQVLNEKWGKELDGDTLTINDQLAANNQYPVLPQLQLSIPIGQYRSFMNELFSVLEDYQPDLKEALTRLENICTNEILEQWIKEVIAVNHSYFEEFSSKHEMVEWLPMFVAEHVIRPFIQKAAKEVAPGFSEVKSYGGCPCCGEPPRLAVISKKGTKEITCPRCLYTWEEKKISCAHCGNTEHGQIEILKTENDERSEIHVCHNCNGYTKVIDTRKMIKKDPLQLLDIKTIHLDFIAQENGFGIPVVKVVH